MTDPFTIDYSDNEKVTVADRLAAEIHDDPTKLDVATGFLTPSIWGIIGGPLTELARFRLLLGKDFELAQQGREREEEDIRSLVREALVDDTQPPRLPVMEDAANIQGILGVLGKDATDVKVWTEGFLHAKAYLLARSVGVGSANFTAGGLRYNRELVAWRQDLGVVHQVQEWFDQLWEAPESAPYKDDLIAILERTRFGSYPWAPYDVLIRTLAERYGIERPASLAQASFQLRWFQEEAVYRLIRLLNGPARGALLADAVGLGKTYMALGVIHHYLYQAAEERKGTGRPVLLIVPASLQEMWERELEEKNLSWACHILTVQRLREGVDLTKYVGADLVVIDEAHRLRSGSVWFQQAMRLLTEGAADKRVLLLTATPVHTSLRDLTNLLRVMTKNRRAVWAPAIADFERYLKRVEKQEADPFPLLDRAVVRRSRSDLMRAYEEQTKAGLIVDRPSLPRRRLSHVTYEYIADGDSDLFAKFVSTVKDLHLAPYDLEGFRKDALEAGSPQPPSSLVGLYVAGLLKRWESSLRAVRVSLLRLETLLRRSLEAISESPPRVLDLASNPRIRKLIEQEADEDEDRDEGEDVDALWSEIIAALPTLAAEESYDLDLIKDATTKDLKGVASLLNALPPEGSDGKIKALIELLTGTGPPKTLSLVGKRVLIFTQYADTAKYVADRLSTAPELQAEVAVVHGGVASADRARLTAWFDPDRAAHVLERMEGVAEPMILVSTDVLAEGHNLQLANAVVNFELHWNPQVVVQRSGRIDRLNSPHKDVHLISFMPDEGIDAHLDLVRTLDQRFGLIHFMGLGDEPVTPLPGDLQTVTFEQLRKLYADEESVLDEVERLFAIGSTDFMRAPLEQFLIEAGEERLREIPVGVQSIRNEPRGWKYGPGVFLALKYEGQTIWRFYQRVSTGWGSPVTDELTLFQAIACPRAEPRVDLDDPPEGPGAIIDWDLLRKAAAEVAEEITRYRATVDIARGASERSRRLRQDLRQLAITADFESEALGQLLDRLEQVRVEDYDAQAGWRAFEERLRSAKRESQRDTLAADLEDLTSRGLELFGVPEDEGESSTIEVDPADLELVSWEWLVGAPEPPQEETPEQAKLDASNG